MSEPNSKLFRDDPAAYYIELGAEAERKRIIKLLEEECSDEFPKVIEMSLSSLIALIKGEQK